MNKEKNYSNLSQEEKDNLHSKCCEGTNEAQKKMVEAYEGKTFGNRKIFK